MIKYFKIIDEVRVKVEEKERFVILYTERLTEVRCKSDPNIIGYHEWRETDKVEISKRQLLEVFQSIDFNPVLS